MSAEAELVGALYLPVLLAGLGWAVHRDRAVPFAPVLLSLLWTLPALLILERLNLAAGWWSFPAAELPVAGIPLALWLGWTILWGVLPPLAFPRLPLPWVAIVFAALDLLAMPLCGAVVHLGPNWLAGEGAALGLVLLPALLVARFTAERTHLRFRAGMQVAIAAGLFLFLLPEITFALRPGAGWRPLLALSGRTLQVLAQFLFALALPGLSAVQEFASRGAGTPIPYDPPRRLVTSGVFRYMRNPMQLSCTLALGLWALVLRSPWVLGAAVVTVVYSAGLAEWDEAADLETRFAEPWSRYRAAVRNWLPRWRPYVAETSTVYLSRTCEVCSQLRVWVEARHPQGLLLEDAETLPAGSIRRMRYVPPGGAVPEEGVRALGRVLEHLNFGWALLGMVLRLPVVREVAQLLADGSGFGPRDISACATGHDAVCGLAGASPRPAPHLNCAGDTHD